jgi:hypothetical protein
MKLSYQIEKKELQLEIKINPNTKRLIVVEGNDDLLFFEGYLKHLIEKGFISDIFQIGQTYGKDKIRPHLENLKYSPNFENIVDILVLFDSDNSYEDTFKTINKATEDFKPTPQIALMPAFNDTENGTLEDLCLKILEEDTYLKMSDNLVNEIEKIEELTEHTPHYHKKRMSTYFSIQEKYVGKYIGFNRKAFNYDSEHLDPLKKILQELYNKNK